MNGKGVTGMKRRCIGIYAHVDAGKTTLSEGLLYLGQTIRKMGRVDTRDAFLDTDAMERARGITIFSKQAQFSSLDANGVELVYTLLDTPGHADFSTEMERTLRVLDAAVLVISAMEGVTGQVRTLWSLFEHYNVPVFVFVNKMDQAAAMGEADSRREEVLAEIREKLSSSAVAFPGAEAFLAQSNLSAEAFPAAASASPKTSANSSELPKSNAPTVPAAASASPKTSANSSELPKSNAPTVPAAASVNPKTSANFSAAPGSAAHGAASANPKAAEVSPAAAAIAALLSDSEALEELALTEDSLLESFMETGTLEISDIKCLILERKAFAVYFGSALRMEGVDSLLAGLDAFFPDKTWPAAFAARIFKITREGHERLTWLRVTGGELAVRQELSYTSEDENGEPEEITEKVSQLRLYSGGKFTTLPKAEAGCVVAVPGLTKTYAGQGLGAETDGGEGLLSPVLTWQVTLPPNVDPFLMVRNLRLLEEEEPFLSVGYNEQKREITVQMMGEVQREILKKMVQDRFNVEIGFGRPSVIYKETIARTAEGVGHFEPLRHYAEVHLLLEPGEPGSGLVFDTRCPIDVLARNWQRLILTHLREKRHRGVLVGGEITDMKITLIGGRAHLKHTEGGDFRQATYRAVRQGLCMSENVLLEPFYSFQMELPQGAVGRAMSDLSQMGADFSAPEAVGTLSILTGSAPVRLFGDYSEKVAAYTGGEGRVTTAIGGWRPCKDAAEIVAETGYDPDADKRNPCGSVFCAYGAGFVVPWQEVRNYMHVDTGWRPEADFDPYAQTGGVSRAGAGAEEAEDFAAVSRRITAGEDELMAIFERTYGKIPDRLQSPQNVPKKTVGTPAPKYRKPRPRPEKEYLLVDGYNMIFAWDELRALAEKDLKSARDRLLDMLSNYAAITKRELICVFDAYRVAGGTERIYKHHNISVIYTKEAETADQYIEKAAHELTKQYAVTVATSDAIEQVIIYGAGALRLSARNFLEELRAAEKDFRGQFLREDVITPGVQNTIGEALKRKR